MTTAPNTEPEVQEPSPAADPAAPGSEAEEADGIGSDLDALLEETKRERDEYLELAQRARADFENYRKRAARETEEAERRGRTRLAEALVPVLDNLERALASADESSEALAEGVKLVHSDLRSALERAGVNAFDPTGQAFDPELHEALSTRPAVNGESAGVVVETVEKGYRIDDRVLRPARVVVSG